ncbi:MAG: bacillithiol biosynthesis cysteine-adding enzyme BshC [Bacteroidia bacterium]|nr:bacillithiol biosynthesis cysteine-adding enzyme BshC [Bacteroidia bacterium]
MLSKKDLELKKELLNPLVFDYLSERKELNSFYDFFPDKEGFRNAIDAIQLEKYDRALLVEVLTEQSKRVKNTSTSSQKNIQLLLKENTFTITTGHQLCLFTGPLYFIYKIFSVINLCEKLKSEFPENNFVPVYWMASEDHDFAEVNHFNVFGKKIEWNSQEKGAVGNFKTESLAEIKVKFQEIIGTGANAEFLVNLFESAYLKHSDLASATQYLVNELFGQYGLIVLDSNSKKLKEIFIPFFEQDIFENTPAKKVNSTIEKLKQLNHSAQVNPRDINCFFMEAGLRSRIEKVGEEYQVVGTDKKFSKSELQQLIKSNPEKISPNVVLRPCYQQFILPNLAYVGGPGELAYWLEYKELFDELNLFFPVLTPRKSIIIIDNNTLSKIKKLGFDMENVFENEESLVKLYIEKSDNSFNLEEHKKSIENLFKKISEETGKIDKTLNAAVEAEKQKNLNSIAALEQKTVRAIKAKLDTEVNQIKAVKAKLFPNGIPQERVENFSTYYNKWGSEFLSSLKENITYDLEKNSSIVITEN